MSPQPKRIILLAVGMAVVAVGALVLLVPRRAPREPAAPPAAAPTLDREKVQASLVPLSCKELSSSGVFIGEDRLITSAGALCDDEVALRVSLPDGRVLIGEVQRRDDWLDTVVVAASGAQVPPLPLGDSTAIHEGDTLILAGGADPDGWQEARVHRAGFNQLGVAYLELDETFDPKLTGSTAVNARGEVVGIATAKVAGSENRALVVPIEYLESPEGEALERWQALLAKVDAQMNAALAETNAALDGWSLLNAKFFPNGLVLTLLTRVKGGEEPAKSVDVELRAGDWSCPLSVALDRWVPLEGVVREHAATSGQTRELEWLLRSSMTKEVRATKAMPPLEKCELSKLEQDPELVLVKGSTGHDRVTLSLTELLDAQRKRRELEQNHEALVNSDEARAAWQLAFESARARVASARAELEATRATLSAAGGDARLEYEHRHVKTCEERLRDAEADLAELERGASLQALPIEWTKSPSRLRVIDPRALGLGAPRA